MTTNAWHSRFQDLEPTTFPDLTGLSPRTRGERNGFQSHSHRLNLSLADIKRWTHDTGFEIDALLQTGWAKVLAAYLGEREGVITFGFSSSATRGLSVPVTVNLEPNSTNQSVLLEICQLSTALSGVAPNKTDITKHLVPVLPKVADTLVTFAGPADLSGIGLDEGVNVVLNITEAKGCIQAALHFQRSLILEDDTPSVFAAFEGALNSVINSLSDPISSFGVFSTNIRKSICNVNYSAASLPVSETIHGLVEHHAAKSASSIALDYLDQTGDRTRLTYADLNRLANKIARVLLDVYHVRSEDPIPVCVEKSPAFYVSILAVLKAGASFTPFGNAPAERKSFMINELGANLVIHDSKEDVSWCQDVKRLNVSAIIDGPEDEAAEIYENIVDIQVKETDLIYQMYTSGSTGRPKAVSLEHRHALQTVMASRHLVPWRPDSRMLQYAAPSFDMCYYDTFLAWSLGICLCSASNNHIYNDLTGVINTLEVNMLGLTPSVAITLEPAQLPSVNWLYCIGEALPQVLVDKWEGRLANSYGPTEAAQMVTLFPVDKQIKSTVIGQPFSNTSFYVLQQSGNTVVPVLCVGELCIGGCQIARAYHANEEKTRNAFAEIEGDRIYRTGDLVRMLGNGTFEFVGRCDDQVKIRGQRVELGEINQAVIDSHQDVSRCCTQILKMAQQSQGQLVAFVEWKTREDCDVSNVLKSIANRIQNTLPPYMIPKIILPIDRIPLLASGKTDRKALTEYLRKNSEEVARDESCNNHSEMSSVENRIRQAFMEVSGLDAKLISTNSTIFQLGVDSIGAIRIASLLRELNPKVKATDVMSNPTITMLSKYIEQIDKDALMEPESDFDFVGFTQKYLDKAVMESRQSVSCIESIKPCSALQAGMIAQTINSRDSLYFNHMVYKLLDKIDPQTLRRVWKSLVQKYEILRTGFLHTDEHDTPLIMVTYRADSVTIPLRFIEESDADFCDVPHNLQCQLRDKPHLLPWTVMFRGEEMHFIAHHSLYDAHVLELFIRDFSISLKGQDLRPAGQIESQLRILINSDERHKSLSCDFWRARSDLLMPTKIPGLTPLRSSGRTLDHISRTASYTLPVFERICRQSDVTLQVLGQLAWARLLSAYTGEDRVTFGTVLSGRLSEDAAEVGFPCITTVPTPVCTKDSKANTLRSLMQFNIQVQKHQFIPLSVIQSLTNHPDEALFDSIFTLQKRRIPDLEEPVVVFVENQLTVDYSLSIELEPDDDGKLLLNLYFRHESIPPGQARIMIDQYDALLCDIASEMHDYSLPTVDAADPRVYSQTPPKEESLPSNARLLHELFELSVTNHGSKTALEYVLDIPEDGGAIHTRRWTFSEVQIISNKVANLIVEQDIPVGSIIAMCFEKCPEAAFVMLGISKAGCSFLALDPRAPEDRKLFILDDSNALLVFTKGLLLKDLASRITTKTLNMDDVKLDSLSSNPPHLSRPISPQDLSYCLYTSGTTGLPKGCAITHENVVQALLSFQRLYKRDETSRWLQFASYHFDVSVMEHFWSWSVGICVVTADRDLVFADLAGTIKRLDISHIDLTPSLARLLDPQDLPTLANGVFVVGGEMLRQDILDSWGPTGAIHNAYGPTEATIGVTMYPGVPVDGRPANIGRQFDNVGSYVVHPEDWQRPVLRGTVGELCVTGKLVAKGYINRPDLTAERFVEIEGRRAYRTGDLVRMFHDGTFDFIGRIDDQVKLRGQRLEIGEINHVMKQSDDAISDVSTQVLKHPKQKKDQLVAFIVIDKLQQKFPGPTQIVIEHEFQELFEHIKAVCESKLPPYMIPTHILAINKMPLSANNKADLKRLKALYADISLASLHNNMVEGSRAANASPILQASEAKIADAVASTLGLSADQVERTANFFQLGLDSISVIRLNRTFKANGIHVTTAIIMQNPTVARLSSVMAGLGKTAGKSESAFKSAIQQIRGFEHRHRYRILQQLGVKQDDVEAVLPCTPLQQGIISRAVQSCDGTYFNAFALSGLSRTDLERLKESLQAVVDNVQILRTKFVPTDEGYAQVILRRVRLSWQKEWHDISDDHVNKDQTAFESYQQWWENMAHEQVFSPLFVATQEQENGASILLGLFHACYDGRSLNRIFECLTKAFHNDRNIDYGPLFSSILPYGPLQAISGAQTFWQKHLKGVSSSGSRNLADRISGPAGRDSKICRTVTNLDGLENRRRELNVTHQAIFQTCWAAVLQDLATEATPIGLILSGSSIEFEGADKVIGPIFNTVPFLLAFRIEDTWSDAIIRCHNLNTEMLPFQHTALRDIQRWIHGPQLKSGSQIFNSVFVYQKDEMRDHELQAPWREVKETVKPDFVLAFEVTQSDNFSLQLTLAGQRLLPDIVFLETLFDQFEDCLRNFIRNSDSLVAGSVALHPMQAADKREPEESLHLQEEQNNTNEMFKDKEEVDFEWTTVSDLVRNEIAILASLPSNQLRPDTSILEVGLDSIDAVKLSSRLKSKFGTSAPVSRLMALLTIREISAFISNHRSDNVAAAVTSHFTRSKETLTKYITQQKHIEGSTAIPATPLQEAMIAEMVNSGYRRYFNHDVLLLNAKTDLTRLHQAWKLVVEKTPLLRSSFIEVSSPDIESVYALVENELATNIWQEVLIDPNESLDGYQEKLRAEFSTKYARGSAPFKLTLIRSERQSQPKYLILSISHAFYDGWSIQLIHEAVRQAYKEPHSFRELQQPPLDPILASILSGTHDLALAFWKQALVDMSTSLLPVRREGSTRQHEVHRLEIVCPVSATRIQEICKSLQITMAAFSQTVWSIVLASFLEQLDVVFGLVLSGRDTEEAQRIRFPTMNTVLARSVIHGSFTQMSCYTQRNLMDITSYQHFPLRKAVHIARSQSGSRELFNTLFIYQKRPISVDANLEHLYESLGGTSDVEYPLCVEAEVDNTRMIWRIASKDAYLTLSESRGIMDQIMKVIHQVLDNPEMDVVSLINNEIRPHELAASRSENTQWPDVSSKDHSHSIKDLNGARENWSAVEEEIRSILAMFSGVSKEDIGKRSSLLSLGLDSITAIKIASLLRRSGIQITVSEMVKAEDITELATVAERKGIKLAASDLSVGSGSRASNNHSIASEHRLPSGTIKPLELLSKHSIKPQNVESVIPASSGQVYMLSKWQNSNLYHSALHIILHGISKFSVIQNAWSLLISQSPSLRTTFIATGNPDIPIMQVVLRETSCIVHEVSEEIDQRVHSSSMDITKSCKTIGNVAPAYLSAKKLANEQWKLRINMPHALYDGYSLHLMIERLQRCFGATKLPPASLGGFESFIDDTYTFLDDTRSFWTEYLSDLHPCSLPVSKSKSDQRTHLVDTYAVSDISAMRSFAKTEGLTMQALFLAVYASTYARVVHASRSNHDVLIGMYVAARGFDGADLLEMPTLGFVPLRIRNPMQSSIWQTAKKIQEDLGRISENTRNTVGLWQLQDWIGPDLTIDTWVNMLSGTGSHRFVKGNADDQASILFDEARESKVETVAIVPNDQDDDVHGLYLLNNAVRDIYKDSVDIEATIWDDSIDVAIIAPDALMDRKGARHTLSDFIDRLNSIGR